MKKLFIATLVSLMLISTVTRADESIVVPLGEGVPSPFKGLLLSPQAVADILADKKLESERTDLEVSKKVALTVAECKLNLDQVVSDCEKKRAFFDLTLGSRNLEISELNKKIVNLQKSNDLLPYYVAGGAVAGVVITILTTFTVSKLTN
jgi:hypothetical protein